MGCGNYYVTSPRFCFQNENYNEWMNNHYHKSDDEDGDDDDDKIIPKWFYLPYCDECEKYREFVDNICSHYRSHRILVTCNYCLIDFKTFNEREVRCLS